MFFQISSFQSTGSTEYEVSPFTEVEQHVLSDSIPFSIQFVAYGLRALGPHTADIQAHLGATTFPPEGSVNAVAQLFSTGPSASRKHFFSARDHGLLRSSLVAAALVYLALT